MLPKLHSAPYAGVELPFDRASAPVADATHAAVDGDTGDVDVRTEKGIGHKRLLRRTLSFG
jgi:hypothetical protein